MGLLCELEHNSSLLYGTPLGYRIAKGQNETLEALVAGSARKIPVEKLWLMASSEFVARPILVPGLDQMSIVMYHASCTMYSDLLGSLTRSQRHENLIGVATKCLEVSGGMAAAIRGGIISLKAMLENLGPLTEP